MTSAVELAKSGEAVKAGPIGLAVILILCIACYFLFKSMSKHMKRVREEFPLEAPAAPPARTTPAVSIAKSEPATSTAAEDDPAP